YKSEYSSVGALREAGHRTAEEVLEEGAVLLKNENGALPLSAGANGVLLTFMGDGKELSFMDEMDIYSLFGNLLDNAIAAVEKLESAEAKLVSMVVERRGDFCLINIMNYYGEPLAFRDGLPETTKREEPGFHGYGLRSIRRIAQKYGGELQISAEDGIFRAMVYLMDCAEEPQKAG
ncbi:MAG: GHKL domain-containing protein, partial [bacterium]